MKVCFIVIQAHRRSEAMCPVSHAGGHDAPWLVDYLVPCGVGVIGDVFVELEDAYAAPCVALARAACSY